MAAIKIAAVFMDIHFVAIPLDDERPSSILNVNYAVSLVAWSAHLPEPLTKKIQIDDIK